MTLRILCIYPYIYIYIHHEKKLICGPIFPLHCRTRSVRRQSSSTGARCDPGLWGARSRPSSIWSVWKWDAQHLTFTDMGQICIFTYIYSYIFLKKKHLPAVTSIHQHYGFHGEPRLHRSVCWIYVYCLSRDPASGLLDTSYHVLGYLLFKGG